MKIAGGGKLKPSSFQQKKIKKIGPSGVKLRACTVKAGTQKQNLRLPMDSRVLMG